MREILFRGRKTDDEKWVYGFYVHLYCIGKDMETHRIYEHFAATDCGDFYPDWYEVDASTVGQYTGLQDKNGKRIFEGDILKVTRGVTRRKPVVSYLFVEFAKGIFETKHIKDNKPCGMVSTYVSKEVGDCGVFCEVIGNIHDNPELMEVQSE